jgi:hypothetical protein
MIRSKPKAFNREDLEGIAKVAKKNVFMFSCLGIPVFFASFPVKSFPSCPACTVLRLIFL